jgi:hypothetical protein
VFLEPLIQLTLSYATEIIAAPTCQAIIDLR